MPRVIGIDPGSRCTGYGIIDGGRDSIRHVASGIVSTPSSAPFPERLGRIYSRLREVIGETGAEELAVEEVFVAKNALSALKLGHARGAAILAGVNAGLPVYEYSALQIKQSVVGYGRAGKDQVEAMIRFLLAIREPINQNASDALAAAVCHLNTRASLTHWQGRESR